MTLSNYHIRAGRAWLDWTQKDLAARVGINVTTLRLIETGASEPEQATVTAILRAFAREGLIISETGIRYMPEQISRLNDFSVVLDDAAAILQPGETLWLHCADERRNSEAVTRKFRQLEARGIKLRFTYARGNDFFTTAQENYRWIDPAYFASAEVQAAYADRYVEHIPGDTDTFLVIRNAPYAQSKARQIAWWWNNGEPL